MVHKRSGELKKLKWIVIIPLFFVLFARCSLYNPKITLKDARLAVGVDENLQPIQITDTFPKGTSKVFCWFKWQKAVLRTKITATWFYVTDNIRILDYTFEIPRREGAGSVSLSMPENKTLPSGSYRIDLKLDKSVLRSLNFKVE